MSHVDEDGITTLRLERFPNEYELKVVDASCDSSPMTALSALDLEESSAMDDGNRPHEYPEGGKKAVLCVIGTFLALLCTFGQMNAFGTFQTWYATHQLEHISASKISWIGSLQLWIFFFSGGPIGRLFDAYGPTYLMLAGTLCAVTSIMLTSVSTQYYQYILSQGVLFGLGVGLLFYPSLSSISTYYFKYRATALGIASAGSSLGGVIFPIMLQNLFLKVGFGWGVRISGFVCATACIVASLCVSSLSTHKNSGPYFDINTIKDSRFILLLGGTCMVALGLFIPFFYIVDFAHYLSISPDISFYVLAIMNAGGVVGRIAPCYLSDKMGRFNLLIPSTFFCGLSCIVLWLLSKSLSTLATFAVLYGLFSGAFVALLTPCVAQISEIQYIGTRIGMLYCITSFPSLVGGPIAGFLIEKAHGSFDLMIIFSGSTLIAGSFFILAARIVIDPRLFVRV